MNTLKLSEQQIKYLKEKTVGLYYFIFVLVVFLIYLAVNFFIGWILVKINISQGLFESLAPLYSCESLILTFFACSKLSQHEFKHFGFVGKKIDLINVLALTTAVIAIICSFSLDHYIAGGFYVLITFVGFVYLYIEAKRDYQLSKKLH